MQSAYVLIFNLNTFSQGSYFCNQLPIYPTG